MLDLQALALFAVPYAVASAIPGAAQGVMVATVAARGARESAPFVAGMVAGNALWLAAAALGLGNPKAVIFYGAVLPQVFDMRSLGAADLALIFVLGAAIDAGVQSLYAILVERARRLLRSAVAMRRLNRAAAVTIAGSAMAIATRS